MGWNDYYSFEQVEKRRQEETRRRREEETRHRRLEDERRRQHQAYERKQQKRRDEKRAIQKKAQADERYREAQLAEMDARNQYGMTGEDQSQKDWFYSSNSDENSGGPEPSFLKGLQNRPFGGSGLAQFKQPSEDASANPAPENPKPAEPIPMGFVPRLTRPF